MGEGRERGWEIVDEKREMNTAKYEFLRNTSTDSKRAICLILKHHANAPV